MTVLSGQSIAARGVIVPCVDRYEFISGGHTFTGGLGPAGYDLSLDLGTYWLERHNGRRILGPSDFVLAASLEHFTMPADLVGLVKDKSSLARRGLSVFNTVIEPGWRGYLTLELVNNSHRDIKLCQGMPIAQVLFELTDQPVVRPYQGKYQDQEPGPQGAR